LVKIADYKKFVGSDVTIKTAQALNNRKNFSGKLESAAETAITIKLDAPSATEEALVEIEYVNIGSANLKSTI
jgi:ribosome maturation factor RimP